MIASGHNDLAREISLSHYYSFLDQVDNPKVKKWAQEMGFTVSELQLIQPHYSYQKTYNDPLLEAAFLLDFEQVKILLANNDNSGAQNQSRLSAALKVAAPEANSKALQGQSFTLRQPPPRKSDGRKLVQFLISKGADPNSLKPVDSKHGKYKKTDRIGTTVFLTKNQLIRKLLIEAGGKLTYQEQLLEAIDRHDIGQIKNLLSKERFEPYGVQNRLPTPLIFSIRKANRELFSMQSKLSRDSRLKSKTANEKKIIPLKSIRLPGHKVVYTLLNHPSKKVTWREPIANPSLFDPTPLTIALKGQNESVTKELLRQGATIRSVGEYQSILSSYIGESGPHHRPNFKPFKIAYDLLIQHRKYDSPGKNRKSLINRLRANRHIHGVKILTELGEKNK